MIGVPGRQGRARATRPVHAVLNLTAMVDLTTMLVLFLLTTFVAHGEICTCAEPRLTLPASIARGELERAPVLTVALDGITVNGEPMRDAGEIRDRLAMEKLWRPEGEVVLFQADRGTDAGLVRELTLAIQRAGYPNVMFIVDSR